MKASAISTQGMRVQLPTHLCRRIERTAQLTKCNISEVIASAVATSLPQLPDEVPPAVTEELAGWTLLDDEALRAIAEAFLPRKQQQRFTVLLRKQTAQTLTTREQAEWEVLQRTYLHVSRNKAKAQYLLAHRQITSQA